jgi:hypothetical protein
MRRMNGFIELEMMVEEVLRPNLRHCLDICLERVRENYENSQPG